MSLLTEGLVLETVDSNRWKKTQVNFAYLGHPRLLHTPNRGRNVGLRSKMGKEVGCPWANLGAPGSRKLLWVFLPM